MQPEIVEIKLPSGASSRIRKLSPFDFASSGCGVPDTTKVPKECDPTAESVAFGVKVSRLALLKAAGNIIINGATWDIVDKPHYRLGKWELNIELIDQDDAEEIVNRVIALSNVGKEAAKAAETFPEGQSASVNSPQAG